MLLDITTEREVNRNILLLDIETSPNLGYSWGKYEQNIIQFEQEWIILSFSVKWLGDKKTYVYGLDDFHTYEEDRYNDELLVRKLWEYLDEADIIIAHNGDQYDIKKINSRFIVHHLDPPAPYKTIDTLKLARKHFKFNSNKLGDLGETLGLGSKEETGGFKTWLGCMNGDSKSWKVMKKYNKQDVILLEDVYYKLRKWSTNHPRVGGPSGTNCPTCGSDKLQRRGYALTATSRKQRIQCQSCSSWHQVTIKSF